MSISPHIYPVKQENGQNLIVFHRGTAECTESVLSSTLRLRLEGSEVEEKTLISRF